jgi:hypothetical protein
MATVLVRHKVNDYAKWKAVLYETKPFAKSNGVRSQRVLRNSANPNEVVVANEFDDMNAAQKVRPIRRVEAGHATRRRG